MSQEATVVFTAKSVKTILAEGGTSAWRLDRNHARQCGYAVCTRNANADWVEGPEPHHSAFLVGKVKDVVPSHRKERYLIQFSEFARVNIPDVWKSDRNPVRYATLEDLGIDPSKLKWEAMPQASDETEEDSEVVTGKNYAVQALTMDEAKKGLSRTFGVPPEAIEITIRG